MQVFVSANMGQVSVFSPAKINLFLAVTGRQASGFHDLASLVAPVDFGDELVLRVEAAEQVEIELRCSDASLPTDGRNLAYAAAARFCERWGLRWKVEIELEKRIPHGAGLGGGSSNASAVLRGLCDLAKAEGVSVDDGELRALAAELGSDCPLFLEGKAVVMRGRGERLESLGDVSLAELRGKRVVLFKPSFSISTLWAYGALAAGEGRFYDAEAWAEGRLAGWQRGELSVEELLYNRFETVAFAKYPGLSVLEEQLREEGVAALMSGSGSCCFALCAGEEAVEAVVARVSESWGAGAFCVRGRLL